MSKSSHLKTPVLFLIFNRVDTAGRVFEQIRNAQPCRLYIAADGPRPTCIEDVDKVSAVRTHVLNQIDWNCDVKTLFREHNLGCKKAVESAISWFLQHEPMGIILEDDCLPNNTFFQFCEELLNKYRTDTRIMTISGNNFQNRPLETSYSYYFSQYPHCWGWATWERAWRLYDGDMSAWPEVKASGHLKDIFHDPFERRYWKRKIQSVHIEHIDTWDYRWALSCWLQNGLTILPSVNLVENVGFSHEATHTSKVMAEVSSPSQELNFPLSHPPYIIRNSTADQITYDRVYSFRSRLWRKIRSWARITG